MTNQAFLNDVVTGLTAKQKFIPCRWLYDDKGSALFEEITQLPEYYVTRTERSILEEHINDMAANVGDGATVVEYGAGASVKTRLLLNALNEPRRYVPTDIAAAFLQASSAELQAKYPQIDVTPVVGDFMDERLNLQLTEADSPVLGFFPGSTVGNLLDADIRQFMKNSREQLGDNALFLLGIDLKKDPAVLLPAYDDDAGVTAAFNLNLLTRINRELGGDFDDTGFAHEARWNADESRIEMHLVSKRSQTASVAGKAFSFDENETVHTENSRKFTLDGFTALCAESAWEMADYWTDSHQRFAVILLRTQES